MQAKILINGCIPRKIYPTEIDRESFQSSMGNFHGTKEAFLNGNYCHDTTKNRGQLDNFHLSKRNFRIHLILSSNDIYFFSSCLAIKR